MSLLEPNDFDEVLGGPELLNTITALQDICSSATDEGSQAGREMLKQLVEQLRARLNDPSAPFDLSDSLERSKIQLKGTLALRAPTEIGEAVAASRNLGSGILWSDDFMNRHLMMLFDRSEHNATFIRNVIEAFLFRAITMMLPSHDLLLVPEDRGGPSGSLEVPRMGGVDYTLIVKSPSAAKIHVDVPNWLPIDLDKSQGERIDSAFFVAVADGPLESLGDSQLPAVVLEMSARAKSLGKSHVRGALTSGTRWVFIALELNPDNGGAKYWVSEEVEFLRSLIGARDFAWSKEGKPALIAAILSTWIQQSFEELKEDEWFFTRTLPVPDEMGGSGE
ncbi:hypothetical protein D9611_009362 [Ephemerocybe angulata]|uniref:Uncharacterized protein n=1 Tax=Ephemerocybe angulata TaxID=980116 RepID=A0A8H5F4C4_9AGAR|nr:hypothetical protein D9611_009362 [Tulosesus angulatus]